MYLSSRQMWCTSRSHAHAFSALRELPQHHVEAEFFNGQIGLPLEGMRSPLCGLPFGTESSRKLLLFQIFLALLPLLAVPGMRLLGSLTQPATHLAVDIRHADVATGMTYGGLVSRPGQIWIWAW